jgi:sugar phosphate isomerase/epimerase
MRYAICNETFQGWDHERVCRYAASLGYTGLEVAPFTLAPLITDVSAEQRATLRRQAEEAGLVIIGLHWLLAKTEGFQITSPEADVRQRTADYLGELARACRDLGGSLMVFGSPAQRPIPKGATYEEAVEAAVDTFRRAAPAIADSGVQLCLEPLGPSDTAFINTCKQACDILDALAHPSFVLHQDVKAMATEPTPITELIHTYANRLGHFHVNDPNMRGPGFGEMNFVPILKALRQVNYTGWVSVEVFDYTPDPETIASESLRYLKECEAKAAE